MQAIPRAGLGLGLSAALDEDGRLDLGSLRRAVQLAEGAGMAGVWVPENVLAPRGSVDPLVLLGWVAGVTETIAIGTAVLLLPYQHPYRLGQRLASLDMLSQGRLVAGVGLGGEGPARSLARSEPGNLAADYERDISILRSLLRGDTITMELPGWPPGEIRLDPIPARPGGPPLWMGASSQSAIARVARLGDGWVASGSLGSAGFTRQLDALRESMTQTARPTGDVVVAKRVYIHIDDDPNAASQVMRVWFGQTWGDEELASAAGVAGSPDRCAAEILSLEAAGAEILILDPVAHLSHQAERIVGELLPLLAS